LEYTIHRFLFHFKPVGPKTERLIFLFHGIHHEDPHDPYRLVMPPTVSVSLSLLMYFIFATAIQPAVLPAFFFGFIFGYLVYDMGHYAFHHLRWKNPVFKYLRKYHYLHHFSDSEKGFGVSSPLWDYVFQTQCLPEESQSRTVASDH
jgi:sterol desaturase/sphingolipid hydroxylase (fatty acid hydroxylase superfamily)